MLRLINIRWLPVLILTLGVITGSLVPVSSQQAALMYGNNSGTPKAIAVDTNGYLQITAPGGTITGGTCTNQFVTALNSSGVPTCTTATLSSAQFANQGTATTILHGNAAGNPTFSAVSLTADVTGVLPAANGGVGTEFSTTSTGNIDDLDFSNASVIRMNNASAATIRGLLAGTAGQRVTIVSVGAGQVNLSHQDTGDATAANRLINTVTSASTALAAGSGAATYVYDGTTARWRLVKHEQGTWITPSFVAGDYTGNGSMTWTVASGDVTTAAYYLNGKTLYVSLQVDTTTVGGTPNNVLRRLIPGGYTSTKQMILSCNVNDNGSWAASACFVTAAGTLINIQSTLAAPNFSASTDNTKVHFTVQFEVT